MAARRRNMIGNTRMDAALDAMGQLGFRRKLVRETVDELLHVYEGNQGWPFIEEASYKLLIETILGKQQSLVEKKKNNTRKDGVSETASAATSTTGITEVGWKSSLVAQDSVMHARDDLDSASQTSGHHNFPSLRILGTDVKDTTLPTKRGGYGRGIRVESKNKQKSMDNVQGSNRKTYVNNVGKTVVRSSVIESSKTPDKLTDNVQGSNHKTYVNNVKKTVVRSSVIESSNTRDKLMNNVKGNNHITSVSSVGNTIVRSSMINKHDKLMDNVKGNNHKTSVSSVENTVMRSSMINKHDKLMDNDKGSNHTTFVNNVENTIAGNCMIESSKTRDELPHRRRRPYYGWIGSDESDDNIDLIYFPVPELPEHLKKLIAQSDGSSQIPRRKSRWDEKADEMSMNE